jgi:hypothetical protein
MAGGVASSEMMGAPMTTETGRERGSLWPFGRISPAPAMPIGTTR